MNVFDKMSQHGPKHLFLRKLTLNLLLQYYSTSVLMHTRPKNNKTEELLLMTTKQQETQLQQSTQ